MTETFITKELYDAHVKEGDERYHLLSSDIKELKSDVKNRVTHRQFTWIIGVLMTIILGMFTYIANQISDIRHTGENVKEDVSSLKTDSGWLKKFAEENNFKVRN